MFVGRRLGDGFYITPGEREPVFHEQLLTAQPMCEPPHLIFKNHHSQPVTYFSLHFAVKEKEAWRNKYLLMVTQLI